MIVEKDELICIHIKNIRTGKDFFCYFETDDQVGTFIRGLDQKSYLLLDYLGAQQGDIFEQ